MSRLTPLIRIFFEEDNNLNFISFAHESSVKFRVFREINRDFIILWENECDEIPDYWFIINIQDRIH